MYVTLNTAQSVSSRRNGKITSGAGARRQGVKVIRIGLLDGGTPKPQESYLFSQR